MKYVWEEEDVKEGQFFTENGYMRCIVYVSHKNIKNEEGYGICHLSSNSLVVLIGTKKETAKYLTKANAKPYNEIKKPWKIQEEA